MENGTLYKLCFKCQFSIIGIGLYVTWVQSISGDFWTSFLQWYSIFSLCTGQWNGWNACSHGSLWSSRPHIALPLTWPETTAWFLFLTPLGHHSIFMQVEIVSSMGSQNSCFISCTQVGYKCTCLYSSPVGPLESSSPKNTTHCLSESRSSLFSFPYVLLQKVSIPLVNVYSLWRGGTGTERYFVLFPFQYMVLAPEHPQCHRTSETSMYSRENFSNVLP